MLGFHTPVTIEATETASMILMGEQIILEIYIHPLKWMGKYVQSLTATGFSLFVVCNQNFNFHSHSTSSVGFT